MGTSTISISSQSKKLFIIAWVFGLFFYFLDYVIRSAPAVMLPNLALQFKTEHLALVSLIGTYYYTYSFCSLIAGVALDKLGAKSSLFAGAFILGIGALFFLLSSYSAGITGRLLQGAGCAFAFPGCVYLASKGFSKQSLATAIGFTQCFGMLGGSAGQFVVGNWMVSGMAIQTFWLWAGIATCIVAVGLFLVIPRRDEHTKSETADISFLEPYKIVFSNPHSWLSGIISGLLFVPTTVFAMTWAVVFFQKDLNFDFHTATNTAAMVALGWVFGCPLLGYITDKIGLRRPVLMVGALAMIAMLLQLIYLPNLWSAQWSMFLFGVASGAAMIPYSIIKEVNPDHVKGSATGAMNFITFGVTTLISPVFSNLFGKDLAGEIANPKAHFQQAALFWCAGIVIAILLSFFIKETGSKRVA